MICQVCNSPNPETAAACVSCGTTLASSPQPLERLPPGTKLSNGAYTIGKVLGQRGGFGITYKGSETVTARVVAIKEFFPAEGCVRRGSSVQPSGTPPATYAESLEEFLNEARTLASFDHPNIARVYFAFTENNTAYMVMEFLDGKTLQKIVDERGFLPVEEAVRYITAVARALEVVHAATIFHRDIKPENIIVTRDTTGAERVVLIDFGAAREFTAGKTRRLTQCLTPGYAPLEQYGAEGRFDQRTDIYALAATLYCLLTGQPPVDAPNRINGVELKSVGDLNIQVSAAVSAVVMRSLSISVKDRPLTVQAFLQSLNQALVGQVPPPNPRVNTVTISDVPFAPLNPNVNPAPPIFTPPPPSQSVTPRIPPAGYRTPPPSVAPRSSGSVWVVGIILLIIVLFVGSSMIEDGKKHDEEVAQQKKEASEKEEANQREAAAHSKQTPPKSTKYPSPQDTPAITDPTPPIHQFVRAEALHFDASSILKDSLGAHSPTLVMDGRYETAWGEASSGSGEGEWIEFTFRDGRKHSIYALSIIGGYRKRLPDKTGDRWTANNRPQRVDISLDEQTPYSRPLDPNNRDFQNIGPSLPVVANRIRLTFHDILKGTRSNDLCISEVEIEVEE